MASTKISAPPSGTRPMLVRLHPVAIVGICDLYERRKDKANRVVGTLMGRVEGDVVEVTNCFAVPHDEGAQTPLRMDTDFAQNMIELTKRASPQEDVVGWFSTRPAVLDTSFYIHDFYVRLSNPNIIHLTIDCTAESDRMPIKAYVHSTLGIPQTSKDPKDPSSRFEQAALFAQVPVEIYCWDAERVGLDLITNGRLDPARVVNIPTDTDQVLQTAKLLDDMLESLLSHVGKVLKDEVPADPEIGRALMDIMGTIPKMDDEAFEKMVNSSRKDVLMVMYLAELAKAQLALQEKVNVLP
ncbi:eukaryotic translation initiation factor 3 subunit F-like [Paramacrobiotus metropolitanus]|uniref:eukaryotic translation initiation factor 3 subunit F-like n=1 Tax=Paramacrobiotus metropolitanus TaxID=2943436 RepID=UPI002445EE2F|nr:eukaryotic translation initiation factor 3 subunit F-like [Paramacrobiotus metropolitanus]